jgi:hypothetical protein
VTFRREPEPYDPEIAKMLWASWQTWQDANLYATWRRDNPGEDDQLRRYWNHGGDVPQLATATGRAYVQEAEAYWKALELPLPYFPPLGGTTASLVLVCPSEHPKSWNSWPSVDLKASKGAPVYAVEAGKIPNIYPDDVDGNTTPGVKFTFSGVSGKQWGYAHVIRETQYEKVEAGAQLGTASGDNLHFCGSNLSELYKVLGT